MTWKRCSGCTRAIAVTAFSCEYCGQLCDDVMDFLPKDNDRSAAAPVGPFEPATDNDTRDHAAENAGAGDLRLSSAELSRIDQAFPRGPKPRTLPAI